MRTQFGLNVSCRDRQGTMPAPGSQARLEKVDAGFGDEGPRWVALRGLSSVDRVWVLGGSSCGFVGLGLWEW